MKEISDYLNEILEYNWNSFNHKKNVIKQHKKWDQFFDRFDEVLNSNSNFALTNLEEIQKEIILYNTKFLSLNIKGNQHRINQFFIGKNLIQKTYDFKFKHVMKVDSCNCIMRKELKQDPDCNELSFIEKEFDGYYYNDVYIYNEC
jgi:hypothetical protein